MRPATILVATFLVWLTAKGRLASYWALATTASAAPTGSNGPGVGTSSHADGSTPGYWENLLFGSLFTTNPGQ